MMETRARHTRSIYNQTHTSIALTLHYRYPPHLISTQHPHSIFTTLTTQTFIPISLVPCKPYTILTIGVSFTIREKEREKQRETERNREREKERKSERERERGRDGTCLVRIVIFVCLLAEVVV